MNMVESRMYTALSFAAFKNHPKCFNLIYDHAMKYNLPGATGRLDDDADSSNLMLAQARAQ